MTPLRPHDLLPDHAQPCAASPFAQLTPDTVLDALAAVGWDGDGRLLQLNSFENRVFQVMVDDGSAVVTKFYRPGRWTDQQILEEHRFSLQAAAQDVPVVAPLPLRDARRGLPVTLHAIDPSAAPTLATVAVAGQPWRLAVWERRAGRPPELEDPDVMHRLGMAIARLHLCGAQGTFEARPHRDPVADANQALHSIRQGACVPPDQQAAWERLGTRVMATLHRCTQPFVPRALRLHGDCHPGNLLWRDERPNMVDLDDCATGPAVQDLWMLLSGDSEAARQQLGWLLGGYTELRDFDEREIAWIPALRLSRLLRHNAWVAARWSDPAFPVAWPDFGTSSHWAQQLLQVQDLIEAAEAASI